VIRREECRALDTETQPWPSIWYGVTEGSLKTRKYAISCNFNVSRVSWLQIKNRDKNEEPEETENALGFRLWEQGLDLA